MKRRLYHPLWTHLPAAVLLAAIAFEFVRNRWVFHDRVPIHFNLNGGCDIWGSGWQLLLQIAIPALSLFVISIFIDELWARQERRKQFNWMAFFDEAALGIIAGGTINYFQKVYPASTFGGNSGYSHIPVWPWALCTVLTAIVCAFILELIRPHRAVPTTISRADVRTMNAEIREHAKSGQRFVYWETQNPRWMSPLIFAVSAIMVIGAMIVWTTVPWTSLLFLIFLPAIFLLYGGLRVSVNDQRLEVRLGILGIMLLKLPITDITEAIVHEFSPLHDFGGYGIRFNREMKAYFFRGTKGVKVSTVQGNQFLIGSDTPEELAVVIQAIHGEKAAKESNV